ncbi:phosphotransferase enzyme family protein [Ruixingdingia sedimenti]|uniref:Phosphotransferase n=1 Tax=Ruixingdingia sedimenti TaxID=3073604 RepID=A0ABU1F578_9RHOB|nr:phosphotransferase [Xinfangfangia sp. LG-4]MDR5652036.1 phosphotransferase [Xinfangfangia sp. LG-4]
MAVIDDDFLARTHAGVASLLPEWGLGAGTDLRLLSLSENATFIATDPRDGRRIVLRANRPGYHSLAAIRSELAWITALRQSETVITPAILPLRNGDLVASFDDAGLTRHVVAFEFMEGREPDPDQSLVSGFEILGAISARLHEHARNWDRPADFTRHTWDFESAFGDEPIWGPWRAAIGLTPAGADTIARALDLMKRRLDAYGKDRRRFGVVHTDLRLANLLMRDDEIVVIDFDDMGFSWYVYDFASAISFHELHPIVPQLRAAWLSGYRTVAALDAEDEAMIPTFVMYRRLALTCWIASHSETETARGAGLGDYTKGTVQMAEDYLRSA